MKSKVYCLRFSYAAALILAVLFLFTFPLQAQGTTDHYAVEVASSSNLGDGVYGHANAVLGEPATWCQNMPGQGGPYRVKLVEAPHNTDLDGNPVITTIKAGGHITVKFAGKVHNNPANPYGIDFIIYSNAFFTGVGGVSDSTNMNSYNITGGGFNDSEPGIVSVSKDGVTWHTFNQGPHSKGSLFPTQAFQWDAAGAQWTDQKMDFTKAVNPALTLNDFIGKSAAQAIALYNGAGGGTGFNLDDVGLDWIRYVRVEAVENKTEVDAFAAVSFLETLTGDVNGDGVVNIFDLVLVGNKFGQTGPPGWIPEDVNKDGAVNIFDLVIVGNNFGQSL